MSTAPSTPDFEVVAEEQADAIMAGVTSASWKTALIAGQMLLMSKRPSWSLADMSRTGMKMRTKAAPDEKVYIWLVPAIDSNEPSPVDNDTAADTPTVPTAIVNPDSDLAPVGAGEDMPEPL